MSELEVKDGVAFIKNTRTKFTGVAFELHPNEKVASEVAILNGILNGIAQDWHKNGQLALKSAFKDNLSHGSYTRWHPNGKIEEKGEMVSGKKHGEIHLYNDVGLLRKIESYNSGHLIKIIKCSPSGAVL